MVGAPLHTRYVFINRLNLMPIGDLNRRMEALGNLAIGLGTWTGQGGMVLRKWPIFVNFDRNVAPGFLWHLHRRDRLPIETIAEKAGLAQRLTDSGTLRTRVLAGPFGAPEAEEMEISFSIEASRRESGASFFFVVHKAG